MWSYCRNIFFRIVVLFLPLNVLSQTESNLQSISEVCERYPAMIATIFRNLDLERTGMDEINDAFQKSDLESACSLLLNYYRTSPSVNFLSRIQPNRTSKRKNDADSVLQDIYTFQEVSDQVPRFSNGRLNWFYNGPEDDIEWAWALNRHYPIQTLLPAWYETGNEDYIEYIDRFIQDWIISSWPYPGGKSNTAMWRGLEVSFRVKIWARVFFELMNSEKISPATRLLILSSLPDHAHYARQFHAQNNWLTMEISGLATVAAYWPEFKNSEDWLNYTISTMVESMRDQIYPDGVQTELTSSYHYVALNNFNQYKNICDHAGIELPDYYQETLEKMWSYLVHTMRPDGFGILNNDADRMDNREKILEYLDENQHTDWQFIATNGKSGTEPEEGPSFFYPWAGQIISRNGYHPTAHWSFFDIGPWGSGHQHNDKLHVSIAAFGHDFLVDAGRFAYRGSVADKFRGYARGSEGHNTILFNNMGQAPGPKLTTHALPDHQFKIDPEYDYAWGSMSEYLDSNSGHQHHRALFYVRDAFWIVVDKVASDMPSTKEILWHWHPDCQVEQKGNQITGKYKDGSLCILPVGKHHWKTSIIKGQDEPRVRGWYSEVYNVYEPNEVGIYSAPKSEKDVYVWLLLPYIGEIRPKIKAKIIQQQGKFVELLITRKNHGRWRIKIPFYSSDQAFLDYEQ